MGAVFAVQRVGGAAVYGAHLQDAGSSSSVQSDLAASYRVIGRVQRDLLASYSITGTSQSSLTAAFNVIGAVRCDLAAAYSVVGSVQRDLQAAFSLMGAVQQDLAASYAVRAAVASDLSATYGVLSSSSVTASLTAAYNVRGSVQTDLVASYGIRAAAVSDLSASFAVVGRATCDLQCSYSLLPSSGGGLADPAALWGHLLPNGKSAQQALADVQAMLADLYKIHGLALGAPLVVTSSARTAGDVTQSIAEVGGEVTIARVN
ncbi:MAG: hypothetical protein E6Q67_12575 [Roseateles sp.]|nr:MAG: hypothetical protein E6Q67_12575 [Roseateles sp.]